MNRMIIQVDTDRVAYDGRDWTPVAGEHAWAIARMMKSRERLYKRLAAGRPDFAYNRRISADSARQTWHLPLSANTCKTPRLRANPILRRVGGPSKGGIIL
jgi:hypothetical protein